MKVLNRPSHPSDKIEFGMYVSSDEMYFTFYVKSIPFTDMYYVYYIIHSSKS